MARIRLPSYRRSHRSRRVHHSLRFEHITSDQPTTIKFKLYQFLLLIIFFSLIYYWHKSFLYPEAESKENDLGSTNGKPGVDNEVEVDVEGIADGYFTAIGKMVSKYAVQWFINFIADPYNIALIMMCVTSRIVLNFFVCCITFTRRYIHIYYEIEREYILPTIEITPPVDV